MYRKLIMKPGTIKYEGQRLTFDNDYIDTLKRSFTDKAFDTVKVFLADSDNKHNMDPKRAVATVRGLETGEGGELYALVEATDDGAKLLAEHPDLGVSPEIQYDLEKSDGRKYPLAIRHLLGTFDPKLTGLGNWEPVQLSAGQRMTVLDLSASEPEESAMFTPEEEERLRGILRLAETSDPPSGGGTTDTDPPAGSTDPIDDLSDEEVDQILALLGNDATEDEDDDTDEDDEDTEGLTADQIRELLASRGQGANRTVAASNSDESDALRLANARIQQLQGRVARLSEESDGNRWQAERGQWIGQGVPPAIVDLAEPLLRGEQGSNTVRLSNADGQATDSTVADVARSMLRQYVGLVDLSAELGTSATDTRETSESDRLLAQWASEYGGDTIKANGNGGK